MLTGFGNEERFIELLLSAYPARIENAGAFALANRVLLLRTESGVGIDVSLGALPYEETMPDVPSMCATRARSWFARGKLRWTGAILSSASPTSAISKASPFSIVSASFASHPAKCSTTLRRCAADLCSNK